MLGGSINHDLPIHLLHDCQELESLECLDSLHSDADFELKHCQLEEKCFAAAHAQAPKQALPPRPHCRTARGTRICLERRDPLIRHTSKG